MHRRHSESRRGIAGFDLDVVEPDVRAIDLRCRLSPPQVAEAQLHEGGRSGHLQHMTLPGGADAFALDQWEFTPFAEVGEDIDGGVGLVGLGPEADGVDRAGLQHLRRAAQHARMPAGMHGVARAAPAGVRAGLIDRPHRLAGRIAPVGDAPAPLIEPALERGIG